MAAIIAANLKPYKLLNEVSKWYDRTGIDGGAAANKRTFSARFAEIDPASNPTVRTGTKGVQNPKPDLNVLFLRTMNSLQIVK